MNGPFLILLAIYKLPVPVPFSLLNDKLIARTGRSSGFVTLSRLTPRRYWVTTSGSTPLTTTMRVIDRVHYDPANGRTFSEPTGSSRFPDRNQVVIFITANSNGRETILVNLANFGRRKFQKNVFSVATRDRSERTRGSCDLSASSDLEFHVMHVCARWNFSDRHRVPDFNFGARAGLNGVAHFDSVRGENIRIFSVLVTDQRDECGTVRIVLESFYDRRNVGLSASKIDDTIFSFYATALVTNGDLSAFSPSRFVVEGKSQRFIRFCFRNLFEIQYGFITACGSYGFKLFDSHFLCFLCEIDACAVTESHYCFFPMRTGSRHVSETFDLSSVNLNVYGRRSYFKNLFERFFDQSFVRVDMNLNGIFYHSGSFLAVCSDRFEILRFLSDYGCKNYVLEIHFCAPY